MLAENQEQDSFETVQGKTKQKKKIKTSDSGLSNTNTTNYPLSYSCTNKLSEYGGEGAVSLWDQQLNDVMFSFH